MSYQVQTPSAKGPRRTGLLVLGLLLLLAGLGTGAALFVTSGSQYQDAVKHLQRAPVGCDTEFNFSGTGTFIFYAESKGKIGSLRGDCENTGTDYNHGAKRISVDLTLTDTNGDTVDLARATGASYDKGGYTGSEIRSLNIKKPGRYTLSVQSDDSDFAIAVGRNPKKDAESMQTIAVIAAAAGVVLGGLFIILGLRRKSAPGGASGIGQPGAFPPAGFQPGGFPPGGFPPASAPNWTPGAAPTAPPGFGVPAPQPYQPPYQPPAQQPYPPQAPQAPPAPPAAPWGSPHP